MWFDIYTFCRNGFYNLVDLFIRTVSLNSSLIDCRMGLKYENVKDRISGLIMDSVNNGFG